MALVLDFNLWPGIYLKRNKTRLLRRPFAVMTKTLKPQQLEPREQLFLGVQSVSEFCSHIDQVKTALSWVLIFLGPKKNKTQASRILIWTIWDQNSSTLCTPRRSCSHGSTCYVFRVLVITETAGVTAWFCFVLGILPACDTKTWSNGRTEWNTATNNGKRDHAADSGSGATTFPPTLQSWGPKFKLRISDNLSMQLFHGWHAERVTEVDSRQRVS